MLTGINSVQRESLAQMLELIRMKFTNARAGLEVANG